MRSSYPVIFFLSPQFIRLPTAEVHSNQHLSQQRLFALMLLYFEGIYEAHLSSHLEKRQQTDSDEYSMEVRLIFGFLTSRFTYETINSYTRSHNDISSETFYPSKTKTDVDSKTSMVYNCSFHRSSILVALEFKGATIFSMVSLFLRHILVIIPWLGVATKP